MVGIAGLVDSVLEGDRLSLARLLTQIENETEAGREALNALFPLTGRAHLIGVTGAPGTGKSTLVNCLARSYRQPEAGEPKSVGVIAVDPTSPFTGGALLGDRVRMRDLAGDPGVFIRSMASRGSLGGLAATTSQMVQALDAAGFDVILIETVGAGQAEVDIARLAHTTLVIEAPGLGDEIQAIKAGILEIADILVINKADRPGAELTERALRSMLMLAHPAQRRFFNHSKHHASVENSEGSLESSEIKALGELHETEHQAGAWIPTILRAIATEGAGIMELALAIQEHYRFLVSTGEYHRRESERLKAELDGLLRDTLVKNWRAALPAESYDQTLRNILARKLSPWQAVQELMA